MRDLGLSSLLGELFGPLVVVFALLTQLGDIWFLTVVVSLTYWLGPGLADVIDRERAAVLVALLFLGLTLVTVGKPLLGWPRPPGATVPLRADLVPAALSGVYRSISTATGFGFPSGHAVGATVVYGGLAWLLRAGRRRMRIAVAAALIAVVSLSRLVLGVHYLVDVLAGVVLGLLALGVAVKLATPRRVFGFSALVAVAGVVIVGLTPDIVTLAALTLGATVSWLAVGDAIPATPSRTGERPTVVLGAITAGPLLAVAGVLDGPLPVIALAGLAGGGLVVVMPLIGERVAKNQRR